MAGGARIRTHGGCGCFRVRNTVWELSRHWLRFGVAVLGGLMVRG